MKCPQCKAQNLDIKIDSTNSDFTNFNYRYCHCKKCHTTFQTIENIVPASIQYNFFADMEKQYDITEKKDD